jgi:spore coat protein U-like protein
MRTFGTLVMAALCLLLLATQAGCLVAAAAAGTGATVAYVRGDLETTLQGSPKVVAEATVRAFKDLDLVVISSESSNLDAKITGRTARDVKMTVVVKGESEQLSRISVRAGTFGNDVMQERLMQQIRQNLFANASTTQPWDLAASD